MPFLHCIHPFPFDDHHQNLIHPYQARPHSPPQTASRSIHPCRYCSHVRTDRWHKRMFYYISTPLIARRANNTACNASNTNQTPQLNNCIKASSGLAQNYYERPQTSELRSTFSRPKSTRWFFVKKDAWKQLCARSSGGCAT